MYGPFRQDFPFPRDVHLCTPKVNEIDKQYEIDSLIKKIRDSLEQPANLDIYSKHKDWVTDTTITRFLIARNFDFTASLNLLVGALKWREKRKPAEMDVMQPSWKDKINRESETGKIYSPGMGNK